jgi:putative transposase
VARRRVPGGPKKVATDHAHLVLIDETGLFLNPTVRRSWAPIGRTPVIGGDGGHRTKVSVIGALTVSPAAHRLGFYFATAVDGYFSAEKVVAFLRDLLRHLPGKVVVIWDGGGNHKGPVIRAFLARNRRLWLVRLPAYAPDLNPVEAVWSWLKWGRLANFVPDDLDELDDWAVEYLVQLKFDPGLLRALWERSDLPFPTSVVKQRQLPAIQ